MNKRLKILIGMAAGMVWAVGILWLGTRSSGVTTPKDLIPLAEATVFAFFPAGLILLALIGRLAQRRFFDDAIIDGEPFAPGSGADIDQRVLVNTVEQVVLALCIWPIAAGTLGIDLILLLGVGFAITRVLFWIGYHISPPLRGFGFAAGFYPTVLAALCTLWALVV